MLLADQDRLAWDRSMIGEGLALVDVALSGRRPGPYQLQAAIAACHASADEFTSTDWPQIAALYDRLFAHQPSPVVAANRAIAVSMSDGPAVGLALLDQLREGTTTARWAPLHIARAELLQHLGRRDEALAAYRLAAELQPPQAERELIAERIATLTGSQLPEAPEN